MSSMSTTLERLAAQLTYVEWTIYPATSANETFACGNPDGQVLRDGQALEMYLAGRWIAGFLEQHPYQPAQFIALDDQSVCGLCPRMRIRLLQGKEPSDD